MTHEVLYHLTIPDADTKLSDFIIPSRKALPEWYKKAPSFPDVDEIDGFKNVKTCVSFLYMWQQSYLMTAPCDFELDISPTGWEAYTNDTDLIRFISHTHEEDAPRNQMGSEFNPNWMNVKVELPVQIMTNQHRFDLVWMQPFYWDQQTELIVAPGVLPILPDRSTGLNINLFVNKTRSRTIKINKGYPLACVYSASGPLKFVYEPDQNYFLKTANFAQRVIPAKEYYKASKKCPYHIPHTNDIKEHNIKGGN